MDRIIQLAKVLALLSVIPVAVYFCLFLHQLTNTTAELQNTARTINTTAQTLPITVDARLNSLQIDVLKKVDTVQDKLDVQIQVLANKSDDRLGSIQSDLAETLGGIRSDFNGQLTDTNKSISTLVEAYAGVPTQLAARYNRDFEPYFNCNRNALCIQGQTSDTMFALRTTTKDVSTTMDGLNHTLPIFESNIVKVSDTFAVGVPKITTNVENITANIQKITHPRWWDRLISYAVDGALVYRSFP